MYGVRRLLQIAVFLIALPTLSEEPKPNPEMGKQANPDEKFILKVITTTGDAESFGECRVSPEWKVDRFSHSSFSTHGSSSLVPEIDRARVTELLSKLPEGEKTLPPPDRRVVFKTKTGEAVQTRVYDRAQLPDAIIEIMRLSQGIIASWSPRILSSAVIRSVKDTSHDGAFCVFPDGKRILHSLMSGPVKIWDASTHQLLKEIDLLPKEHIEEMVLSPDGLLAAVQCATTCYVFETQAWKLVKQIRGPSSRAGSHCLRQYSFSADSSTLTMLSTEPKIYSYDTKSWNSVDTPPGLPPDARFQIRTRDSKRAVVFSKEQKLELWDLEAQKCQKVFDVKIEGAGTPFTGALSPDESMLALSPGYASRGTFIRIWNMATGEMVEELLPFEARLAEQVDALRWSPDGKYVIAAIKGGMFDDRCICIWSVKSGRQRGTLVLNEKLEKEARTLGPIIGMEWMDKGQTLVAGDRYGQIHFWNQEAALKTIREFEESLENKVGK